VIRLVRRSGPAEVPDVEHPFTQEQRRLLDRAQALADEAEETLAAARREAQQLRQGAHGEAEEITSAAKAAASGAIDAADAEADRVRRQAEADSADRVASAQADADRIRAEAEGAARRLMEEGRRRLDETITEVGRLLGEAERTRALFQTVGPPPESAIGTDPMGGAARPVESERGHVAAALQSLERAISAVTSDPLASR
jgi:cell division septum initiation protein DivIVA